jgi:inosose dehydratase
MALRTMVAGTGLAIAAFYHGSALLTNDPAELDVHRRAIDYTASLGTRVYMVAGGWISGRSATDSDYHVLADNLNTLGKYASDQGIILSFHPHMGSIVENLDQVDTLMGLATGFSLCPDTAHLVAAGSDSVQTILRHGDRTTHFHVKDYKRPSDGVYSGRCFVELGEGDAGLDFPAIFSALDQVGYHEWLVVELDYTRTSAFASAAQSMQYLTGLLGQQ